MELVFSLGGSLLAPNGLDDKLITDFSSLIKDLSEKHRIIVVVGGGKLAREYIDVADKFNASDLTKDNLGITATHLNAMLFAASLGAKAIYTKEVTVSDLTSDKVIVTGGTTPGHSTDAVAAEIAAELQADLLINASNIDGVYDKDPKENTDAKLIEKLTHTELLELVSALPQTPGKYALLDKLASELLLKHKIKTLILGASTQNIRDAIDGKTFKGTIVE